jgi:hypothetical protein
MGEVAERLRYDVIWGGENRSISDDFGDETDTTFVPITQGVALGYIVKPLWG